MRLDRRQLGVFDQACRHGGYIAQLRRLSVRAPKALSVKFRSQANQLRVSAPRRLPHSFLCRKPDLLGSFCNKEDDYGAASPGSWDLRSTGRQQEWLRKDLHLVLVNPVIPQNVGNIARTCAATGVGLHLVAPLGFEIDDRRLKRAGLDYWPFVAVRTHDSWQDFVAFFEELPPPRRLMGYSKFAESHYAAEGLYRKGDWLVFGAETTGLPDEAHRHIPGSGGQMLKIPMKEAHVRSLNLSVSVGVGVFEAIRQLDGPVF